MARFLPFFLCLLACSPKHKEQKHTNDTEDLLVHYGYIEKDVLDALDPVTGWLSNEDCDGTLWNGLACSLGMPVRIDLAEFKPGEIHRRPYKACYTKENGDQGSKSTISRDMLTGYLACLIERKDLDALRRLARYGEANAWVMGEPKEMLSRVLLTPNLVGLLGRAIYELSEGDYDKPYRHLPTNYLPVTEDFERHVQTQGILLQARVSGSITPQMLAILTENHTHNPSDPLFSAALGKFTGNQQPTIDLLLSGPPCPSYVRGAEPDLYCSVNWLQAAKIVIEGIK